MASHAFDFRIVEPVGRELVVRAEQLEHRGAAEDQVRLIGRERGRARQRKQREASQHQAFQAGVTCRATIACHEKSP